MTDSSELASALSPSSWRIEPNQSNDSGYPLIQKQPGIGFDPQTEQHQRDTSDEGLKRGILHFAADHFELGLILVVAAQVHRAFHPDGPEQANDKADSFDVHAHAPSKLQFHITDYTRFWI